MKWLQGLAAIVIDPHRCPDTAKEFSEYEYEVGRDGTVLPGYVMQTTTTLTPSAMLSTVSGCAEVHDEEISKMAH